MTIEFTPEEARILLGFLGIKIPEQPAEEEKKEPEPKVKKEGRGPQKTIDRGKLFALVKAGWPTAKIADELDCSQWSVLNILKTEAPDAREEEK